MEKDVEAGEGTRGGDAGWMGAAAAEIAHLQLWQLVLAGTHDSCTHTISSSSNFAPDAPSAVRKAPKKIGIFLLLYLFPPLQSPSPFSLSNSSQCNQYKIVARWAKAQGKSALEQLRAGVRYLDLRIAFNEEDKGLYTCHSLYGEKIEGVLREVAEFLREQQQEVVILDFNHLYNMGDPKSHKKLIRKISRLLGKDKLILRESGPGVTLRELWDAGERRVVVIYQDNEWAEKYPFLWHGEEHISSPWPDPTKPKVLKRSLERTLESRLEKQSDEDGDNNGHNNHNNHKDHNTKKEFFVLQGVLTPDANLIARSFLNGSLVRLAAKVNPQLMKWIEDDWAERYFSCLNIIIVDHFDTTNIVALSKALTLKKAKQQAS